MALSQRQRNRHDKALERLRKGFAGEAHRLDFFENFQPSAVANIHGLQAFFTPTILAQRMSEFIHEPNNQPLTYLDMGAGIGILSFMFLQQYRHKQNITLICLETNQEFIDIGKHLVPQATWIQGDMFDQKTWLSLPPIDHIFCNPPFALSGQRHHIWLKYRGDSSLMAIELIHRYARGGGLAILPKKNLPFAENVSKELTRFLKVWPFTTFTPTYLDPQMLLDDSEEDFKDTKVNVELSYIEPYPDPLTLLEEIKNEIHDLQITVR